MVDHNITTPETPEEIEIQEKKLELSRLSEELAQKEMDLEDARLSLRQFQRRYYNTVGRKYVILDDLLAQIAELTAAKKPYDQNAKTAATQARSQAKESAREFDSSQQNEIPIAASAPASDACKSLYRQIASLIHPDKALDDATKEIRTRLMAELNDAYSKRDMDGMKKVLAKWHESPEAVAGVGPAVELVRIIRAIARVRRRIKDVAKELSDILASELYSLMIAVREADLQGRDMLVEMARDIDDRITQAQNRLASLKAGGNDKG